MPRVITTKFHNLKKPLVGYGDRWFVLSNDNSNYALTNDGKMEKLKGPAPAPEQFYFDTEVLAHLGAAEYYESHYKLYPYHDEWTDAVTRYSYDYRNSKEPLKTVESEVMEF